MHDYLVQDGGAERVVAVFKELFPKAPIYTLFYDADRTIFVRVNSGASDADSPF